MPGWLEDIGIKEMAKVIDDVLKVYVLNRELLDKKTTVEEFAQLYNELGEFESGVVARLLGPVGAAIFGGVGAVIVTGVWARLFPDLRRADRLE